MFFRPRLPMLRSPREDSHPISMTFPWNMSVSMLLPKSLLHRMREGTTALNCSGSRLPRQNLLKLLILSSVRTRISPMKSRISLTNLEMEEDPFTIWTSSAGDLKPKRRSSKPLWRKLKLLLRWRRTRFSVLNLNSLKLDKTLTDVLLREKTNSTIPGRIMPVQWTLLEPPLKLNNAPREKLFASRSNSREKSMSLKLDWIMPTKPMLRD